MNTLQIIEKKRDNEALSNDEIKYFIQQYADGEIPDYQAAAWCMSVYHNGMSAEETTALTMAMAESGDRLDMSDILEYTLDKHSSGGVGDKTSLVVLPLVVACGVPVAKMSGRGLSFTGGTLDKMESISGYKSDLSRTEFLKQAEEFGIVLAGQTAELAPADGKLYALRDVTGTVPSTPLIASSIMSKKIAAGADGIVLDVKAGVGAFMQTVEEARELGQLMVEIGRGVGRSVTALITDMNQPLGKAVGNAIEVKEAIATLQGDGPEDFKEHCIVVAGHMLRLAGKSTQDDLSDIRPTLEKKLSNGEAWKQFKTLVEAQGGNVNQIENPDTLPQAEVIEHVDSPYSGYLQRVNAREIGLAALYLGAGRQEKGDPVDHGVGLSIEHNIGEFVEEGERLFTVYARSQEDAETAKRRVLDAHSWSERPGNPLVYDAIFSDQI